MLYVQNTINGDLSACSIAIGILGTDGVRRGALADIDLFTAFEHPAYTTEKKAGKKVLRHKRDQRAAAGSFKTSKSLLTRGQNASSEKIAALATFYANPANEAAEISFFAEPAFGDDSRKCLQRNDLRLYNNNSAKPLTSCRQVVYWSYVSGRKEKGIKCGNT